MGKLHLLLYLKYKNIKYWFKYLKYQHTFMSEFEILNWTVLHGGAAVGRWTGSLNRLPASAEGKSGNITSAVWQLTLCDPIWHVSFP